MTLRNRYNKIMEKVKVTPEMEARILQNLSQVNLDIAEPQPAARRTPPISFPKILSLAACLVVLAAGAFALRGILAKAPVQPPVQPPAQVTAPVEYDSPEALCEAAGFPLLLPTAWPKGMEAETYTLLAGGTAEVTYSDGNDIFIYRMAQGSDDISGDYNEYPVVDTIEIGAHTVTLKGGDDGYRLALWTDGTYTFALASDKPMPQEAWASVILSLRPCR